MPACKSRLSDLERGVELLLCRAGRVPVLGALPGAAPAVPGQCSAAAGQPVLSVQERGLVLTSVLGCVEHGVLGLQEPSKCRGF